MSAFTLGSLFSLVHRMISKIVLSLLLCSFALYGRSDVEAINLSLQTLQSEETLLETSVLDNTLDNYRGTISPLYKRYLVTTEEYGRIEAKFTEEGIPLFFSLIPYAESKFSPLSRGYGTAGLWQFSKQSARNFGLSVTKGNDERLHIDRSTEAAIRYIKSLKKEFGSWYLADFAYAMGEGTLRRLIQKNGSKSISVLLKDPHFPSGTKAHFAKTLLLDAKIHYTRIAQEENEE
ncbi:lytic transglycosylase domain-containing protein [Sulfuricurvum sp.]|uniref:lytic transglycosylase domain-containing protein n=1 Tax=Sulfuricurvum sp. TaxID=2025608 RepID=UPI0025CD033C|nr:lytic transglycosylase domain-containing protein [Sulfuricurvum sp.]